MEKANSAIAAVIGQESTFIQAFFKEAIARWRCSGLNVVGLVEETHQLADRVCSAGILRNVTSNELFPIYLDVLPRGATCHIDGKGAFRASESLIDQLPSCDIVVLSKFGKLEASGTGLAGAFRSAKSNGKCMLTAVSHKHVEAWEAFAPEAIRIEPSITAIQAWFDTVRPSPQK